MKLLDKKAISTIKASERKLEIDEGAKLAKKIDYLRETASKEESRLAKFREESLKVIRKDVECLSLERDALKAVIKDLEMRKEILLIPLDAEWARFHEKAASIETERIASEFLKASLNSKSNDLKQRDSDLKAFEARLEDLKGQLIQESNKLSLREKGLLEAQEQWKKDVESYEKASEKKKRDLLSRETIVGIREGEVKLKADRLHKLNLELTTKEAFISDQYQTLLKAKNHGERK